MPLDRSGSRIRRLSDSVINRIAAGEVVSRPASVVKELIENALDAQAKNIAINFASGGRDMIRVMDDGMGMCKEDMLLALERHATSKIDDDDPYNIQYFGFRGEALASIAAVSRYSLSSRQTGSDVGWRLSGSSVVTESCVPCQMAEGTIFEVRDLFFSIPARLGFLKTENTEKQAILDVVRKFAIINTAIAFSVMDSHKELLNIPAENVQDSQACLERLAHVMGKDFAENMLEIRQAHSRVKDENLRISGFIGVPTYNRRSATLQYFFINGRIVKDIMVSQAVRAAYGDLLSPQRSPVVVLFIDIDTRIVDVNVHPAKSEVRFRNPDLVRRLVVEAIQGTLSLNRAPVSTEIMRETVNRIVVSDIPGPDSRCRQTSPIKEKDDSRYSPAIKREDAKRTQEFFEKTKDFYSPNSDCSTRKLGDDIHECSDDYAHDEEARVQIVAPFSGGLRTSMQKMHIHGNYIVAEEPDGLIIIDQHALHERIAYEQLKKQAETNAIERQVLLIPVVVEMTKREVEAIQKFSEDIEALGLVLDSFGNEAICVREIPALLQSEGIEKLVVDIADDILNHAMPTSLTEKRDRILSTITCHYSIRSGRVLRDEEIDALLKDMQETPASSQCNHGRPTYISLKIDDIEKLFKRK